MSLYDTYLKTKEKKEPISPVVNTGGGSLYSRYKAQNPTTTTPTTKSAVASPTNIKTVGFPEHLGGGQYKTQGTNEPVLSPREYGGLPTKEGNERDHIVSVALGGTSDIANVEYKASPKDKNDKWIYSLRQGGKVEVEQKTIDEYKKGNISLQEAIGKIQFKQQQIKGLALQDSELTVEGQMKNKYGLPGLAVADASSLIKSGINKLFGKKEKTEPMRFPIGEGLSSVKNPYTIGLPEGVQGPREQIMLSDQDLAQQAIDSNIAKSVEERANPVGTISVFDRFKQSVANQARKGMPDYQKAIAKEKAPEIEAKKKAVTENKAYEETLTPQQRFQKNDPLFIKKAKFASEVLDREIKPENIVEEEKNFTPEEKLLIDTVGAEKSAETAAQIATAPIRFLAGYPAAAIISYALERADSDLELTPTTDIEKLLVGDVKVQRLMKSEDLYGIVARGSSPIIAVALMAILENPFIAGTGVSSFVKSKLKRESAEYISKLGMREFIKLVDDGIKTELKAGRIAPELAEAVAKELGLPKLTDDAIESVKAVDNTAAKPSVEPKIALGEAKTTKAVETVPEPKKAVSEPEFRYHETSPAALEKIKSEGLKPSTGQYGKGVYFAPETGKQEATKTGAIIRVKKDELGKLNYSEFPEQGWTTKSVPAKYLEFSTDNGKTWESAVKKAEKVNKEITNPLTIEARKYKTPEEFIDSFDVGYRGRDKKFGGPMTPQKGTNTLYFSAEEEIAREYGDEVAKRFIKKSNIAGYGDRFDLIEEYIEKTIPSRQKEFTKFYNSYMGTPEEAFLDFLGKTPKGTHDMYAEADKILIPYLKKQGYDGFRFESQTFDSPEFAIFDASNVFDDKQLKEIWNKANNKSFTNIPKRDMMEVKNLSKKAMELTKKNDGVTISLKGDIPTTGYVYSPSKTTEKIIPVKDLKTSDIEDYILAHYEELQDPKNHFGNWKNGEEFVMDISRVETDLNKASTGAKAADQDGIFNLDTFETINRKDYEKLIDNVKTKNTRPPRKTDVKTGASGGLSGKGKGTTPSKGGDSKVNLPKKPKIKYEPIEKPVDLRKKIKVERTIAEQSTPKRIQKDAIEKGLIDVFKDIPEYDKINMKEQAAGVAKLLESDYDRAIRIALGQEMPTDNLLPESVLIGVKNQALKDGDTDLLIQLATDENGVAKGTTLLGQRIKALDEGMEDDAFRNIRKVVENRKKNISTKSTKEAKAIRDKAAKSIREAKPNKYDWQALVKEITCK